MALDRVILAAGGVVWRKRAPTSSSSNAVEVLVVHRPKYDDWTFPKGKCDPGERCAETAVREIEEETGLRVRLGMPLPTLSYPTSAGTKEVAYWSARPAAKNVRGPFVPNAEVDEIRWVRPADAGELLTYPHDRAVLAAFEELRIDKQHRTRTLVAVRHGQAVSGGDWSDEDLARPLSDVGRAQSESLKGLLAAFGIRGVVSSPALRCASTVEPYAKDIGTFIEIDDRLGEDTKDGQVRRSIDSILERHKRVVVCTHRPTLPLVLETLGLRDVDFSPGEAVVVHHRKGRVLGWEKHAA